MASLIVHPANAKTTVEVRVAATTYVFEPGVPRDVPNERLAAITAALQALEGNMTSPTPTVTPTGTTGATAYTYEVVAVNENGDTTPSATTSTATGNATLTGVNYNAIAWGSAVGARSYRVVRTASAGTPSTTGLIGTVTSPTVTFNDTGIAATVYTPAGAPVGATSVAAGPSEV
jgi:hypothetical protein